VLLWRGRRQEEEIGGVGVFATGAGRC
jgi:hypothetical protein